MKTLIIYDSLYGNTKLIALTIAEALEEFGQTKVMKVDEEDVPFLEDFDLIILGAPTQNRKPTENLNQFLDDLIKILTPKIFTACFDTRYNMPKWKSGSAAKHISKKIKKAGSKELLPPESFFINRTDKNLEEYESKRAYKWALALEEKFEEFETSESK